MAEIFIFYLIFVPKIFHRREKIARACLKTAFCGLYVTISCRFSFLYIHVLNTFLLPLMRNLVTVPTMRPSSSNSHTILFSISDKTFSRSDISASCITQIPPLYQNLLISVQFSIDHLHKYIEIHLNYHLILLEVPHKNHLLNSHWIVLPFLSNAYSLPMKT